MIDQILARLAVLVSEGYMTVETVDGVDVYSMTDKFIELYQEEEA